MRGFPVLLFFCKNNLNASLWQVPIPRTPVSKILLSEVTHRSPPSKPLNKRDYMGVQNYKKFLTYKNGMSFCRRYVGINIEIAIVCKMFSKYRTVSW